MLTYLSNALSGDVDPFLPHLVLIASSVLAGVAVGAGIVLESPTYPALIHRVAFWLVVVGVGVESFCTVCLFAFDEAISGAQQAKIISLEPRRLSLGESAAITAALMPFAEKGISIESYIVDAEADVFGEQLGKALAATGIWVDEGMLMTSLPAKPIAFGIHVTGDDAEFVDAIVSTLHAAHIDAQSDPAGVPRSAGFNVPARAFRPDAIVFVGVKPLSEVAR